MRLTRRGWLGATGAAALSAPALAESRTPSLAGGPGAAEIPPASFQVTAHGNGRRDYGPVLKALAAYARLELAELGLPGMTLSVTDSEGFTALLALGWADVTARAPMRTDHLFQIGSISKSFLALAVLSLADEGRIDLHAPLSRYLPGAAWPRSPITAFQIMSHTAGLPDGAPLFPRVADGRLWTGTAPGSRYAYSNTGFNLLGAAVEHVTGLSCEEAILRRVRAKIGVADIAGDIDRADRSRFPIAYLPWDQRNAAQLPGARMAQATWDPEDAPAGSIGASGEMMARYLRALLAVGAGRGAPVLSDASARLFATPVAPCDADFGPGSRYALGVAIQPVDGAPCLHHTGGMVAFSSSFHADPSAGVAAFASVNGRIGDYRPRQTTAYAIRLMRAARAGAPLPPPPDPWAPSRVRGAAALFGEFAALDGRSFALRPGGGFPRFIADGSAAPLYRAGRMLATPHPGFALHSLDPILVSGVAAGFWWGDRLFARGAAVATPETPLASRALAGVYLNRDPWAGYLIVLARGGDLVIEGVGRIVDRGRFWSLDRDPGGVERFRFDGVLNGRATRLNASGTDFIRLSA